MSGAKAREQLSGARVIKSAVMLGQLHLRGFAASRECPARQPAQVQAGQRHGAHRRRWREPYSSAPSPSDS
jgi:hypothetical protein